MGMAGKRNKYSDGAGASDPAWRVVIAIGPSRRVAWWVMGLAALALACVLHSGLHGGLQALASAGLVGLAVIALRREACREGRGAVRQLVAELSGRLEVMRAGGQAQAGRLCPGSFVAPWLVVVRWRPEGARFTRTVLVPPDAVEPDAFRRLRVLLRWG